jgi:hypothetical protein
MQTVNAIINGKKAVTPPPDPAIAKGAERRMKAAR